MLIELLVRVFARAVVGFHEKILEPPDPWQMTIDTADADSVLSAAAMFEHDGEWDRALSLYEFVLRTWTAEHGPYAQNCIDAIQEKIARTRNES